MSRKNGNNGNSKKNGKGKGTEQLVLLGDVRVGRKARNRQTIVNIGTVIIMAPGAGDSKDPILAAIRDKIRTGGGGCNCDHPLGSLAPEVGGPCVPKVEPDAGGGAAEAVEEPAPPRPAPVPEQPHADEQQREEDRQE